MAVTTVLINVADVGRSTSFYTRFLDAEVVGEADSDSALLDLVTARIRLRRLEGGTDSGWIGDDLQAGFRHLGFKVAALEPMVQQLKSAGVPFHLDPLGAEGGVRITFFFDPDGTLLELVEGPLQYHEVFDRAGVEADWALGTPQRPRFDHVAETVNDFEITRDYYGALGFQLIGKFTNPTIPVDSRSGSYAPATPPWRSSPTTGRRSRRVRHSWTRPDSLPSVWMGPCREQRHRRWRDERPAPRRRPRRTPSLRGDGTVSNGPLGAARPLGNTGLRVSLLTAGGAPLGSMPENFGYEVAETDAIALVGAVLDSPIRAIDTANGYSDGRSEKRIGRAIAAHGGIPEDFLVVTKVDALGADYSGGRVHASLEESRRRLGLEVLPLVHLHDPEFHDFGDLTGRGGAVEALVQARDAGTIDHIGLAGGDVHQMSRYLDLGVFEVLLVHNRWTLVDRSAEDLIRQALGSGLGIVNAAVYGGGILAKPASGRNYGYRPAPAAVLGAIARMAQVCDRAGTDLATAALRFSTRDERLASTIVGFSRASRIDSAVTAATTDLSPDFWEEMESLVPARENWLDSAGRRATR
jgi:D-threo-aldose 1-dehydrogenase